MQEMTEEAKEFVMQRDYGILATTRKDGAPHQAPISYNFDGETIVISSGSNTAKTKHLRRDGRASLSVPGAGLDVVVIEAKAEIVEDSAEVQRLQDGRLTMPPPEYMAQFPEWGPQIILRLTPLGLGTVLFDSDEATRDA